MKPGLDPKELQQILNVFNQFPSIERVVLFGSRAMGNFKKGSDVDLAVFGNIQPSDFSHIKFTLNEKLPLAYFFDVILYHDIKKENLRKHIQQHGITIYKK